MELLGIPLTYVLQGGWFLLALIFSWLIYLGKMIPKGTMDVIMQSKEERITDLKGEVEALRKTVQTLDQALDKQAETADEITEAMGTLKKLVTTLQEELSKGES